MRDYRSELRILQFKLFLFYLLITCDMIFSSFIDLNFNINNSIVDNPPPAVWIAIFQVIS